MSTEHRETAKRLFEKIDSWPAVIENSMITLHTLKGSDEDTDPIYAVVSHNPFDIRQYQVLAIIPALEMEIAVTNEVKSVLDRIVEEAVEDEDLSHLLDHMKVNRLTIAAKNDREFAHKAVDARFDNNDLEAAGKLYQEHYGLTSGGDFNRPLYD